MRVLALAALLLSAAGCQPSLADLPAAGQASATQREIAAVHPAAAPTAKNEPEASAARSGPLPLAWKELDIGIEPDTVFEPWMMTTAIKSLEGETVRIAGYMHAGVFQASNIREFVLLRDSQCPFGREGEAHHAIQVELQGDQRTSYTPQPIALEGTFHVAPWKGPDGNTWSLYRLEATRLEPATEAEVDGTSSLHSTP